MGNIVPWAGERPHIPRSLSTTHKYPEHAHSSRRGPGRISAQQKVGRRPRRGGLIIGRRRPWRRGQRRGQPSSRPAAASRNDQSQQSHEEILIACFTGWARNGKGGVNALPLSSLSAVPRFVTDGAHRAPILAASGRALRSKAAARCDPRRPADSDTASQVARQVFCHESGDNSFA